MKQKIYLRLGLYSSKLHIFKDQSLYCNNQYWAI